MLAERGVNVDHTTIYLWVQRYAPEIEKRLCWYWRNPTDLSSWHIDETYLNIKVGLYDCSVNTSVFESWVEQDLLPKLKSTSVLIMDNTTFHKAKKLIELIKSAGHYIVWLPKYSPDLNPIEKMWSRVKSIRKKFRVKDIHELFKIHCAALFSG